MIRAKGMKVGICIKPSTSVAELDVLLNIKYKDEPLFEMVNILSVEPGFSKQSFNFIVLDKIKYVYDRWGDKLKDIACDGAITSDTAKHALNAGANYLVSGGYIFDSGKNEIVNQYKKLYQELMVHGK
jgi:ribulose-phosphate 3-epimerase